MNVTELMLKLRKPFMPPAAGSAADMSAAGGPDAGALLPAEPAAGALPVGEKEVQKAIEALVKYKAGKAALEARIIEDERWYKLRHWEVMRGKRPEATRPAPTSAWLFNTLQNKHADAADNYPQPNVLPREPMDEAAAESLSQVLPVILERNGFEGTYSENWWEKLKHGTAAYGVFWNGTLENGVGDIDLHKIDLLNIFWEPGITDLEKSKYLFVVDLADKGETQAVYPQLLGKSAGAVIDVAQYVYDDEVDTTDKALIVDCYYKVRAADGRTLLHLMKFCGETLLFASENEARYQNRGFYDHGKFPVVFDVLFPEKGTPAGFGYVAITKDPQLYIDKLGGCLLENALLATRPRYFVSDASGINREQFLDLAEPIVEVAGALDEARVRQIPVTPLSGVYFNIYRQKIEELKETSSNRDFNSGGSSGGVTAAAAIAALQEAGSKASRDMIAGSYRAYTAMVYLAIELIRQFYDEARTFRITGESSRPLPVGSAPPAAGGRYRAASEWQQLRDFEGSPADRTKSLSCNREDEGRRASGEFAPPPPVADTGGADEWQRLGFLEGAPPTEQKTLVATGSHLGILEGAPSTEQNPLVATGKELARWQKKVARLSAEIRQLKSEQSRAERGLAQWGKVVDSTLAQIALSHGAQVGEGAWEIVVPLIRVYENDSDYTVTTSVTPDGKNYLVRVEKRVKH
ncbi:MAG TPA: hypothetical protein VN369_04480 [Terriglobales bacterium]|nr:hypothetical protein [Terriglobales bacterium]